MHAEEYSHRKRIFFKSQNRYLSQSCLELTYFCYWLKYFCCYFQSSIVFQPVPLPVLKFGFDSIEPTVLPLRLQTAFTKSQGYSLELYIKWHVTHSWKTSKYCFLLLHCALNLVLPPTPHERSSIHRLCITTSIAFGNEDFVVIFQLWKCCLVFKRISWMET